MTIERFAPSIVMPDGRSVTPEGWMWVLGLAFAGVPWAIEAADTPAFKARAAEWMRTTRNAEVEAEIAELEQRIARLRTDLR